MGLLKSKLRYFIIAVLFLMGNYPSFAQTEPLALFLTWKDDPTTTMIIDWHTRAEKKADPVLWYQKMGQSRWKKMVSKQRDFPYSERTINRVELTGLEPGTRYRFHTGDYERIYWFETMPETISNNPLVFAMGGDTYDRGHEARKIWMERMNTTIMKYHPEFIVWGGDLAYADGKKDQVWRWYGWFDAIKNTLITEDGKVTPILVSIGNHESNNNLPWKGYTQTNKTRKALAPFFYNLFAFPGQPGYNVLDFGNYLSLIVLDTDHTNPIHGQQSEWLKNVLSKRQNMLHVFPVYHVPGFPSTGEFGNRSSVRVRKFWMPLFDQYDVPIAFEHHDHAYKRMVPIEHGKMDPKGTVYIGDGGWGTQMRIPHDPQKTWYLEEISRSRHGIVVSLHGSRRNIRVVSENGNIIDEIPPVFAHPDMEAQLSSMLPGGGISLSAELAKRIGPIYIDSDYPGYTDGGFAFFEDSAITSLTWEVPIEKEGRYKLRFRYSTDEGNRLFKVAVNGRIIKGDILFPETGGWKNWSDTDLISVRLKAGQNKIELRQSAQEETHIDRLEVYPSEIMN